MNKTHRIAKLAASGILGVSSLVGGYEAYRGVSYFVNDAMKSDERSDAFLKKQDNSSSSEITSGMYGVGEGIRQAGDVTAAVLLTVGAVGVIGTIGITAIEIQRAIPDTIPIQDPEL